MTSVRMVYLLEEQTQLNLIQLRDHLKLLSLLGNIHVPGQWLYASFQNLSKNHPTLRFYFFDDRQHRIDQ